MNPATPKIPENLTYQAASGDAVPKSVLNATRVIKATQTTGSTIPPYFWYRYRSVFLKYRYRNRFNLKFGIGIEKKYRFIKKRRKSIGNI